MVRMPRVTGVEEIKENIRRATIGTGQRLRRGLIAGGRFLQRESQKIVPIEFGVLKNSAGTAAVGYGAATDVVVYYTASYAVYVHEMGEMDPPRHPRKPGKSAKFLEKPAREKREEILAIIAGVAKI